MANNVSVASVIDKNKITSNVAWLILLEIRLTDPNTREVVDTIYIARNNEPVVHLGKQYLAGNFNVNIDQQRGAAPSASITAEDHAGLITGKLDAYAGGIFSEVIMRVVNSERLGATAEVEEVFQVVSSSVKGYQISFTLGAENPLNVAFPKHTQRKDRCSWRFRGYGCGYSGAVTTCDYSKDGPNGCKVKGNLMNFRGLPGLVRMNI